MSHHQEEVVVRTPGRGLVEITGEVRAVVRRSGVDVGLATVFVRHTSASLLIQENADPTAAADLEAWLERLAPDGDPAYRHDAEGPDDMPAHLRATLTGTSHAIPVAGGAPVLGTWQGVFLAEHRTRPHERRIVVHVSG